MATSQNGYAVHSNSKGLRKWVIPGTGRHLYMRDDHAGFVLACYALEHARRVEKPSKTWDWWGWAYRAIRGRSRGYSNHASATAADLNATQHPLGTLPSRNFTPKQIATIQALLKASRYNGVVRWGGNYSGRKDGMHFEINRPYAYVQVAAERLAATDAGRQVLNANKGGFSKLRRIAAGSTSTPAPKPSTPAKPSTPPKKAPKLNDVSLGINQRQARAGGTDKKVAVQRLQRALIARKVLAARSDDGYYGKKTKAAYKKWQRKLGYRGKDADGIPGTASFKKLVAGLYRPVK